MMRHQRWLKVLKAIETRLNIDIGRRGERMISNRDILLSTNRGKKHSSETDLCVETRLVEILPCIKSEKTLDYLDYKQIRLNFLNMKTLRQILKNHLMTPDWSVFEDANYFAYQYEDKPKIYISKKDGRIYSEVNNNVSQFQAFFLLRMLVKYGYVEGYKRIQRRNPIAVRFQ
jgi:hypothetical protein